MRLFRLSFSGARGWVAHAFVSPHVYARIPTGSGKSTFTTELERHIETTHRERCDGKELVLIKVNLPTLMNPLSDLVRESLLRDGFRDAQISELRDLVRKGKVELVLLLDAYDELKEDVSCGVCLALEFLLTSGWLAGTVPKFVFEQQPRAISQRG